MTIKEHVIGAFRQVGPLNLKVDSLIQETPLCFVFGEASHECPDHGTETIEAVMILPNVPEAFASEEAFKAQTPIAVIPRQSIEAAVQGWDRNREYMRDQEDKKPHLSLVHSDDKKLH